MRRGSGRAGTGTGRGADDVRPCRARRFPFVVVGARVGRHAAVADVVMTDVCPHSLGVAVARAFGGRVEPGAFFPILDRNVTVPVSRVERFHTMAPQQDNISIEVFQGEHRLTADNTFLGSFDVKGLRHLPGQPHPGEVDIRFSYDANGILEVEATVLLSLIHI